MHTPLKLATCEQLKLVLIAKYDGIDTSRYPGVSDEGSKLMLNVTSVSKKLGE